MAKEKQSKKGPLKVFIVTGGTGRTCKNVLRAALAQFENANIEQILNAGVLEVPRVREIIKEAAQTGGVVFHSFVETKIREAIFAETQKHHVPAVDVLGPTLALLEDHLHETPRRQPGLSYQLSKAQFDRIDAVDFTLEHDDGCGLHSLDEADVVLVGVSRVSKSVTCFYLSYRGIRAANVPLVPGHDPPAELLKVDPDKVIGLTMNPNRLSSVREARIELMGRGPFGEYGDRRAITAELRAGNELMEKFGWRTIDVSYKSTEEVAKEVLARIGR